MTMPSFTDFKVSLFELLEWAVCFIRRRTPERAALLHNSADSLTGSPAGRRYLWVYASTIGELNALGGLLTALTATHPASGLVILTDHPHYLDAFRNKYPQASVISHGDSGTGIDNWFATFPPLMLLITEIPVLMFDAPCRLSFKVLYYCVRHQGQIFLVNGWRYGEVPGCTMDRLESRLFARDYTRLVTAYMLQTPADLPALQAAGVPADKLHVTGNLKFDNLLAPLTGGLERTQVAAAERTLLICGCVTNVSEQQLIVDTCRQLKATYPTLLCVLAPRHPENRERMAILANLLQDAGFTFQLRTQQQGPLADHIDFLILDTFGELQQFYQLGDLCYVGLNHNLLEPLAFLKPTYVTPGWDHRYPSYPLYQILLQQGLIIEPASATAEALAAVMIDRTVPSQPNEESSVIARLQSLGGALDRNLNIIGTAVPPVPRPAPL